MGTEWRAGAGRRAAVAVAAAALVALGAVATRERTARDDGRRVAEDVAAVLAGVDYDNEPAQDVVPVTAPGLLGSDAPVPAYRARRGGTTVAIALTAIARQGYAGPIRLLVGIDREGRVLRVRATRHGETPGVADLRADPRAGWLRLFSGRSLGDPATEAWAIGADGGSFDQVTGATVTSRAVVASVRDTLESARREHATLFGEPAAGDRPAGTAP